MFNGTPTQNFPVITVPSKNNNSNLLGFSNYVAKTMIDRYEYLCTNDPCLPCGRL